MANIQGNLNKIKNAVLGVDVRDSIHDGIKAINEEVENTTDRQVQLEGTFDELVINAGNSNPEVAAARVDSTGKSHGTLGKRLNNFDSQIKDIEKQPTLNYPNTLYLKWIDRFEALDVNVKDFGAVGDGVTDDSEAIQAAISYALSKNIYRVIFPYGNYVIMQSILLPSGMQLYSLGKKKNTTQIRYKGDNWAIKTSGGVGEHRRNTIIGLSIYINSKTAKGGILLGVEGSSNGIIPVGHTLKDIEIHNLSGTQIGIMQKNASSVYMENVMSTWGTGGTGLLITADGNNSGVCTYNNCSFGRVDQIDIGLELRHGEGGLDGYVFNGCYCGGKSPVKITGTSPVKNVVFNALHVEPTINNEGNFYGIDINAVSGLTINSLTLFGRSHSNFKGFVFREFCNGVTVNGVDCNEFDNATLYYNRHSASLRNSILEYGCPTGSKRNIIQTQGDFSECLVVEEKSINIKNVKTSQIVFNEGDLNNSMKYSSTKPTTIGRGDFVFNRTPSELGNAGSKYVIIGWIGVGTNVAVECRNLTGN